MSALVAKPIDAAEFGFQFIMAFGAKKTTVYRLSRGDLNQSDVRGVLQHKQHPHCSRGLIFGEVQNSYKGTGERSTADAKVNSSSS